jgi:membrane-bound inhibitor of C-type lysozyme
LALALAACHAPAAKTAAEPPASMTQGPVNPDAGVTTYRCADGSSIEAGYPDQDTAVVTYKGHAYTLKRAPAATGDRYTGYGIQWQTRGGHAAIAALKPGQETTLDPGLACEAAAEPPTATHTAFTPVGRER